MSFGFKHLWENVSSLGNKLEKSEYFERNNYNNRLVIYILPLIFGLQCVYSRQELNEILTQLNCGLQTADRLL